jgi:hypothetical protein
MIKYSIAMGIRLVCILACFVVPGYWVVIPMIGAVVLPYIAVVLANVTDSRTSPVASPGQLSLPAADDHRDQQ